MKKKIGWLITTLIPLFILLIPTNKMYTQSMKLFFAITIFVILIIAFELLSRVISALLLPILYSLTGIVSPQIAFSSWCTSTVGIVIGGLIFCTILRECGIFERIAYKMIILFGGTYKGAVIGCFVFGIVLNVITFCNAWLVIGSLVFGVCQAMGLKSSKESALICFAGIVGASGSTVFLYYPGYYMILESSIQYFISDFKMAYFSSFIYNGIGLIIFFIMILVLLLFSKLDLSNIEDGKELFKEKYRMLGAMNKNEKNATVGIVVLIIYLILTTFTNWPVIYGFLVVPIVMLIPTLREGSYNYLRKVDYSIVIFISSCLGIGIVGKEIGFDTFLMNMSLPLLRNATPFIVLLILMFCGIIANFFMTPYAMLGGLSIPFIKIGMTMNIHPLCVLMTLLWSCEILIFPYESAGYFIMYGYGMISMKEFIKYNIIKSLLMIFTFVFIMYPLWKMLNLVFLC